MKYGMLAAIAATGLAVPVQAFDGVTYRVEAHGGWDRVTVGGTGDDGQLYGIGIGIDVPLNKVVFIGFEGNADLSSVKECASFFSPFFFTEVCDRAKRDLSAVARVGADVGGGVKLYALGGYTNARITETITSTNVFAGTPITNVIRTSANGDGWRLGAGAEVKLGKSAYTKLEYRYSDYEGGYKRHQVVAGLGLGL